jgi:hypothetical protein
VASRVGRNVKMGCRRIMVVRRCALLPSCDLSVFLAFGPFSCTTFSIEFTPKGRHTSACCERRPMSLIMKG